MAFGRAKALRHLLRSGLERGERRVYVGDEVRDVSAAREVGIATVAVGWGCDDAAALEAARPDLLVEQPSALARSAMDLLALTPDRHSAPGG